MARPRARTRACSRRSEMNGFSDRAIVLGRRRRGPPSPDDPILLLFLVLLGLFLLRRTLVVVPDVFVLAASPGGAVGAVADDVVVRAGAGAAIQERPAPGVLDVALVVAVLRVGRRLLRLDLQVIEDQRIAALLLLERVD